MSEEPDAPTMQAICETIDMVDRNAQLLLLEIRATRLKSQQTEAALALVLGFLSTHADSDDGYLLHKVAHQLRTCAEDTELAARVAGCEPDAIDPMVLRAAANVIFGGEMPPPEYIFAPTVHALH